jgi:hypothetical protein
VVGAEPAATPEPPVGARAGGHTATNTT